MNQWNLYENFSKPPKIQIGDLIVTGGVYHYTVVSIDNDIKFYTIRNDGDRMTFRLFTGRRMNKSIVYYLMHS